MAQEEFALSYIYDIRKKDAGIGGKKIWQMYKTAFQENNPMGRDRFECLIDRYNLKVRKRRRKPRTTDSSHRLPLYPNLIKSFIPTAPNQLWVSDITYIPIWLKDNTYRFCYLSLVLDAYSKEIVGWSVGDTLETIYPLLALKMALKRLVGIPKNEIQLIHHSDRGCQYASLHYVQLLQANGIKVSMTESGDPKDNAQAERINNTIKNELLKDKIFSSLKEVYDSVSAAVEFYNTQRPHMSINMMTPYEASLCTGEIKKRWISYREKYIKEQNESLIQEGILPLEIMGIQKKHILK